MSFYTEISCKSVATSVYVSLYMEKRMRLVLHGDSMSNGLYDITIDTEGWPLTSCARASPPLCTPPLRASPHTRTSSLVPRSFRYLRRHGNGKSASGTCPRWLMAPFALGSLGVESLLRHRSLLGALVFKDCYVAARS